MKTSDVNCERLVRQPERPQQEAELQPQRPLKPPPFEVNKNHNFSYLKSESVIVKYKYVEWPQNKYIRAYVSSIQHWKRFFWCFLGSGTVP